MERATFAAGCFWGVEGIFRGKKGVIDTRVGFMGGHFKNPTYEDVLTDTTGHAEVVQVDFDESEISYATLLRMLFKSHNPTIMPGKKYKYRSSIFYHNKKQKEIAKAILDALKNSERFLKPINTTVVEETEFYLAEERHQHYYEKRGRVSRRSCEKNE